MPRSSLPLVLGMSLLALGAAAPARADDWFPHPSGATWEYTWSDNAYSPTPTREKVTVQVQQGPSFTLAWTTDGENNPPQATSEQGLMSFVDTSFGLENTNWASTPPPASEPILCATPGSCSNSLTGTLYNVIWGNRVPVLGEPLLRGTGWTATGGGQNDIASSSQYLGQAAVSVPAFSHPVLAGVVRATITQAGALGDPYGSGVRTIWWVKGVGPVKVVFDHAGGSGAPVTTALLQTTNLVPQVPPSDVNYFPLQMGLANTYRWTNTRHLRSPEVERTSIDAVSNGSARMTVKSVSGPLRVAGSYGFTLRLNGITNIFGATRAASLVRFPRLGHGRHFFTPIDLLDFGFNPLITAYPRAGQAWTGGAGGRDYSVFGVTGATRILGVQSVTVPGGRFMALVVRSTLSQRGYPYGSGTRTAWLAPGRGLVKLVFRHRDGSVSLVQLLK